MNVRAPLLILGYGNLARGDDALGPAIVLELETRGLAGPSTAVEIQTEDQLQIEHVTDLKDRSLVLFVDAHLSLSAPFTLSPVTPEVWSGLTTHAMSPGALLGVFSALLGPPPPAFVLALRGEDFTLGHPLSAAAEALRPRVLTLLKRLIERPEASAWSDALHLEGEVTG